MRATSNSIPAIDPAELAKRVRAKREAEKLSLRAAAKELGISASTLSRVENGTHVPESEHLVRLARWAGLPLDRPARRRRPKDVHGPDASTMEAVELHLRADKELTVEDAEMLVDLMRRAYERLSERTPG